MKTTIEIDDLLLREAKRVAASREATLRDLVELALRQYLDAEQSVAKPFRLRKHAFHGEGVEPGIVEGKWAVLSSRVYEGHGG